MFKKIEPLTPSKHQDLRFDHQTDFRFAEQISAVMISVSEFRPASRYYPIIIPNEGPCFPHVLLSLEHGKNRYLDQNGKWKVPYIPAFLRYYPFTIVKMKDQKSKSALCLDPDAVHFKSGMGEPLFSVDGSITEFVRKKVLEPQTVYSQELNTTSVLFNALEEKSLIVDREFKVQVNGEQKSIKGFKTVDLQKLRDLDDESLAGMVRNGTIALIYEHANSLPNINNLLVSDSGVS